MSTDPRIKAARALLREVMASDAPKGLRYTAERALAELRVAGPDACTVQTHHAECWRSPRHHACAVAELERMHRDSVIRLAYGAAVDEHTARLRAAPVERATSLVDVQLEPVRSMVVVDERDGER